MLRFDFRQQGRRQTLLFANPVRTVVAHEPAQVRPALREIQAAAAQGLYAAGYLSYEAAPAFDPALEVRAGSRLPLLWFGLYRAPLTGPPPDEQGSFSVDAWRPSIERQTYDRHIGAIRAAISAGETYQSNYTLRLRAHFAGDDLALYRRLREGQDGDYCAYLNLGRFRILSASPELFFSWDGRRVVTRPMKGTSRRGRWSAEDDARAAGLIASEKERAENLMIVDLLRNDLGRIARPGSIRVPQLFTVERYRSVLQMTSSVEAETRPGVTLEDIFAALFPCGSVTGAPKISTMRLLATLEDSPREVYCGAIGLVTPDGGATFNVAIRTALIDSEQGTAEYGVGGGITWDSTAEAEYDEIEAKAAVLSAEPPDFALIETLLLEQDSYWLLERHMSRLAESARFFGIPAESTEIRAALEQHARRYPGQTRRVRLLVDRFGRASVESLPLAAGEQQAEPRAVALAQQAVSSADIFLFHKTTRRAIYETRRAEQPDLFDVLLFNEHDQVTEFTIGNLVAEIDGQLWTPLRECGLLAGTLRAELLEQGTIAERVITSAELHRASRLWLINSVRGWVEVRLQDQAREAQAQR